MPSYSENTKFADSVIEKSAMLDDAIDWISNSMDPEEVFNADDLKRWAEDNGYCMDESERG